MTKKEMLTRLDEITFREKDYKTMLYLVKNTTPKLFVKIFEEILLGNLYISDFELVFSPDVSRIMDESLEIQDKIALQYRNMLELRKLMGRYTKIEEGESIESKFLEDQLIIADNPSSEEMITEQQFLKSNHALSFIQSLNPSLPKEFGIKIYEAIISNPDVLLLETDKYNIPLEMDNIVLDISDQEFMAANNLTKDQMKKMKALANYMMFKKYKNTSSNNSSD